MWAALLAALIAAPLHAAETRVSRVKGASVAAPLSPAGVVMAPAAAPTVVALPAPAALAAAPAAAAAPSVSAAAPAPAAVPAAGPRASLESQAAVSRTLFDQALIRALDENPEQSAALESNLRGTAYGASLSGAEWKPELARVLAPRMALRAQQAGFPSAAAYAEHLASSDPKARAERAELAKMAAQGSHGAESWTYLFRDHPLWQKPLEQYLDRLIADRKREKRLDLQSVGAAYGAEAYTLAIVTHRALRRAGQNPADWDVAIRAYDVSVPSLLTAGRGLFRVGPRDAETFKTSGAAAYFEKTSEKDVYQLKPELRRWIRPAFADLNDADQHAIPHGERADVVFANYLLYHLRLEPAARLANYWLSGKWASRGFLSMAQVVIGETGDSARKPATLESSLLRQYDGNVGTRGRGDYGDTFAAPGGVGVLWRDFLRGWTADGRRVRAATQAFNESLHADPFHAAPVDKTSLIVLENISARRGIKVRLTNEDIFAAYDRDAGTLYVGVGAVLVPGGVASLARWAEQEIGDSPPLTGVAVARISVTSVQGAALTLEDRGSGTVLRWLDGSFTPITLAYRGDNAAKTEEQLKSEEERTKARQRVRIYGLN